MSYFPLNTYRPLIGRMDQTAYFTFIDGVNGTIMLTRQSGSHDWSFMSEKLSPSEGDDYAGAVYRGLKNKFLVFSDEGIGEKWNTTFHRGRGVPEFARFFVVYYASGQIAPKKTQIEDIRWVNWKELSAQAQDYSLETQYWITHANWDEILRFTKAYIQSGIDAKKGSSTSI